MTWIRKIELSRLAGCSPATITKACRKELFEAMSENGLRVNTGHPSVGRFVARHLARNPEHALGRVPLPAEPTPEVPSCAPPRYGVGVTASAAPGHAHTPEPPGGEPKPPRGKRGPGRARRSGKQSGPAGPVTAQADLPPSTIEFLHSIRVLSAGRIQHTIRDLGAMTLNEVAAEFGTLPQMKDVIASLKNFATMKKEESLTAQRRGELIDRRIVGATIFPFIELAFRRLVNEAPQATTERVIARVLSGKTEGGDLRVDVEALIRNENSGILKDCKSSVERELASLGWEGSSDADLVE